MKKDLLQILFFLVFAVSVALNVMQYREARNHTALITVTEFVTKVNPILEEMDTTCSLRNYEVLREKLYNECKVWRAEDGKE